MKKVLFICDGNVGRSQMAEGFYNYYKNANTAISAGVNDVGAKYNYRPREDIILAMAEKGIDISGQKVKQVTENILENVEKVVVLCDSKLLPDFNWPNIVFNSVQDPFESSMEGVREIRDNIEKIVLSLISENA